MTVSWLQLERYALGELAGDERADVERRLAESSEDRACLDAILNDVTTLPPLPVRQPRKRSLWWAGPVALAAALALTLWRPDIPAHRTLDGVKGGDVAITLIGERVGAAPSKFRDGDRFKLLVTCPPSLSSRVSVVMFQGGQRYTPLATTEIACGNQVPWPGAFALDGAGDVEVCVTWSSKEARTARDLEPDAVCTRLEHE